MDGEQSARTRSPPVAINTFLQGLTLFRLSDTPITVGLCHFLRIVAQRIVAKRPKSTGTAAVTIMTALLRIIDPVVQVWESLLRLQFPLLKQILQRVFLLFWMSNH